MMQKASPWIVGWTSLMAGLSIGSAVPNQDDQVPRFDEIDVERINIVEKDGTIKLVLSNKERFPDPVVDGEAIAGVREKEPGILLYNDRGDEMGGLVFGGADGSVGHGFFFDQDRQDQTLGLVHQQQVVGGETLRYTGLSVWDRPLDKSLLDGLAELEEVQAIEDPGLRQAEMNRLMATYGERSRVFLGRGWEKSAALVLCDGAGRPRLRMTVTDAGAAALEFLDADGRVTRRVAPE